MKTILIDAVSALIIETENGNFKIFKEMQEVLDKFPNKKIILTNADDDGFIKYGLNKAPYEIFTLKHKPEKTNPEYYKQMLNYFKLTSDDVIYFEHGEEAVISARSVGIKTYHWDNKTRPLKELHSFLEKNI